MDWREILNLAALLLGGGGGLVALINWWANRGKMRAEVQNIAADTEVKKSANVAATNDEWRELYDEQKKRADNLEARMDASYTEFQSTLRAEHKRAVERETEYISRIEKLERDQLALQGERQENITLTQRNQELTKRVRDLEAQAGRVRELEAQVIQLKAEGVEKDAQIHGLLAQVQELKKRLSALEKRGTEPLTDRQS